jgi:hypothetical protein
MTRVKLSRGTDSRGRFIPGNQIRKGKPNAIAAMASKFRHAVMGAVTLEEIRGVMKTLLRSANQGNVQSAQLVFKYTIGPPVNPDVEERMKFLEALISGK